jgi:hypothetical protein
MYLLVLENNIALLYILIRYFNEYMMRRTIIVQYKTNNRSRDSSVGIATDYGLDDQERREFESR